MVAPVVCAIFMMVVPPCQRVPERTVPQALPGGRVSHARTLRPGCGARSRPRVPDLASSAAPPARSRAGPRRRAPRRDTRESPAPAVFVRTARSSCWTAAPRRPPPGEAPRDSRSSAPLSCRNCRRPTSVGSQPQSRVRRILALLERSPGRHLGRVSRRLAGSRPGCQREIGPGPRGGVRRSGHQPDHRQGARSHGTPTVRALDARAAPGLPSSHSLDPGVADPSGL